MRRLALYAVSLGLILAIVATGRPDLRTAPTASPHGSAEAMSSPPGLESMDVCFAPGTPEEYMARVQESIWGPRALDFRIADRWNYTATNGYTGSPGAPITLTYSFVPDGVAISDDWGTGPSVLYQRFNQLFGNESVWKAKFAQVFARWSEVCGISYVEVSDDGAAYYSSPGLLGSRGDVRIACKALDGGSNVLAYDYYPDIGDMCLDASENWGAPGQNYIFLRNIVAHEHGHGWGLAHVCPINSTKLLEPYYSSAFDGPQHDDIRAAQRNYGDPFEPNNNAATATGLGTITTDTVIGEVSINSLNDDDYYRFTLPAGKGVSLRLSPVGREYLEGPQQGDGNCSPGTLINSLDDLNLDLYLYESSGTTVLAQSSANGVGEEESIRRYGWPSTGGSFVVRVDGLGADNVQLYDLEFDSYYLADPHLADCPLDFDTVALGEPATRIDQLVNNAATTLNVTSIVVSDPFTVTPQGPVQVGPGATLDLTFSYPADELGRHEGTITVNHSGPGAVLTCEVIATTVGSWLTFVTSDTADFGILAPGSSTFQRIPVRANGNLPLEIQAVQASAPFSISFSVPYTLNPAQTVFMNPVFAPTTVGEYSGYMVIRHTGTSSPDTCYLFGRCALASEDDQPDGAPRDFRLAANYPNPFNATTRIAFDLPRAAEIRLEVFDLEGRLVRTLAQGAFVAGRHAVGFDGSALATGMYLCRLSAPGFSAMQKMMLLK